MSQTDQPASISKAKSPNPMVQAGVKIGVLAAIVLAVILGDHFFGDSLKLSNLASKENELRRYQSTNPFLVSGIAFMLYVALAALSLPGAGVMTIAFGWYFGFVRGVVLASFASTAGATLAFLMSRYFLRDMIQRKFGGRLASFNDSLKREGAFYLFSLRLFFAIPFLVVNAVMGLTPVKTSTFWWVSQLGMLPATTLLVYAGSQFPDLKTVAENGSAQMFSPQLIAAFIVLGLFPLAVKTLIAKFRPSDPSSIHTF
ncbi:MAG: TVP38/TMEM64 family protein [Fuerstiella sp.]